MNNINTKDVAKQVRIDLKVKFPEIKFSVTSDNNSINISYLDGVPAAAVEAIATKYRSRIDGGWGSPTSTPVEFHGEMVTTSLVYVFVNRSFSVRYLTEIVEAMNSSEDVKVLSSEDTASFYCTNVKAIHAHEQTARECTSLKSVAVQLQRKEALAEAKYQEYLQSQNPEPIIETADLVIEAEPSVDTEATESADELDPAVQEILDLRRDRREEKLYNREEAYTRLAGKHKRESSARYEAASQIASYIPFGQPILVGHHSERRHRSDAAKIDSNMRKSIEHQKTAAYYQGKLASMQSNNAISSTDPDAIAKLEEKLANLEEYHQLMVAANKVIRKKKLTDEQKIAELGKLGISERTAASLLTPGFSREVGFASFQLSNSSANIRSVKQRLALEKTKLAQAAAAPIEEEEYPELGVKLVRNREIDRLQLVFDAIPSQEVRSFMGKQGFKFSRYEGAWQRHLTNAEYAASCVIDFLKDRMPNQTES